MRKLAVVLVLSIAGLAAGTAHAQQERCGQLKANEKCHEGNGAKAPGGGEKVSHKGWPAITGIYWQVEDGHNSKHSGTPDNDELLGHHGNDTISGLAGKDVIWGDWEPNNPSGQKDVMYGGDGNDFIYPSHGLNRMFGGRGNDRIIAFYGHGTIDCGPGKSDFVQTRENGAYKVKNCEVIRHFCAFGSKPNGDCKKPGEKASVSRLRP
jgi:RTX calcium-binding nonapeptide repeat (4 copies)